MFNVLYKSCFGTTALIEKVLLSNIQYTISFCATVIIIVLIGHFGIKIAKILKK